MNILKWRRPNRTAKKKILIVDDEPNIVRTVADRLKISGYEVVTASDGQEGVERACRDRPHLILLDIVMPQLDGHAAFERLRQMDETKSIPIIMLTARSQVEDVARAASTGAASTGTAAPPAHPQSLTGAPQPPQAGAGAGQHV